jgi:hypothetical protein
MRTHITTTPEQDPSLATHYTRDQADKLARQLTEDDGDWTYRAMPQGDGRAIIEVTDEDEELLGWL